MAGGPSPSGNADAPRGAGITAFGATHVPTPLLRYLKPGGRMVLPLAKSEEGERAVQRLTVIETTPLGVREQVFDTVRFVPLLPGLA